MRKVSAAYKKKSVFEFLLLTVKKLGKYFFEPAFNARLGNRFKATRVSEVFASLSVKAMFCCAGRQLKAGVVEFSSAAHQTHS